MEGLLAYPYRRVATPVYPLAANIRQIRYRYHSDSGFLCKFNTFASLLGVIPSVKTGLNESDLDNLFEPMFGYAGQYIFICFPFQIKSNGEAYLIQIEFSQGSNIIRWRATWNSYHVWESWHSISNN